MKKLITDTDIYERLGMIAKALNRDYLLQSNCPRHVVAVANGGLWFGIGLHWALADRNVHFDAVRATAYTGTERNEETRVDIPDSLDVRGHHVILVDDIIDSGRTTGTIAYELQNRGAASVKIVAMLGVEHKGKKSPADYVGFKVSPGLFYVGFGIDFSGLYRNLPGIFVLDQ